MNKTIIMTSMVIFSTTGDFAPMLFGNKDMLSGWAILGGLVGGIFGIWVGVVVSKRFG